MSNLFGTFYSLEKEKPLSLVEMVTNRYSNKELVIALLEYLAGRKEQRNLPSRIAWGKQLTLLDRNFKSDVDKIKQVETATIRGWRQVAYDNSQQSPQKITRADKVTKEQALEEMKGKGAF